jgi:hypothetical protein
MSFTNTNKTIVAFKNLLGKSMTDPSKELGNEAEGIFLNIPGSAVWTSPININPAIAITQQVVEFVTANLVADPTSNGHSFFAVSSTQITGGNPLKIGASYFVIAPSVMTDGSTNVNLMTGTTFVATMPTLSSGTVVERIMNAVPPSYGFQYEAKPFAGITPIPVNDVKNWIYQYNSGIFFQQNLVGSTPTSINVYRYIGNTLANITGGSGNGAEWQNSVLSRANNPSLFQPQNGDRYLIIATANGDWTGKENNIAEWNGTDWLFTMPTNGMSVKVDNEDMAIYHYEGNYPGGSWEKIPMSTVRAGMADRVTSNEYESTVFPDFASYETNLILLLTFSDANTGPVTLNVNSRGNKQVQKIGPTGTMVALSANDIMPNIVYMITYDGSEFQIFTGGSNSIGPAEDGNYTDGLFTDFTAATPIGTAIDRFNEILKAIAPSPAPVLSNYTATKSSTVAAQGKLSFSSAQPLAGYTPANLNITFMNTDNSVLVTHDGTWSANASVRRLGISPAGGTSHVTGVLNDHVTVHPSTPNPAYVAKSFGDADKGYLRMYVNGIEISSAAADLASTDNAINTTSGNTVSGFVLSVASPSLFPQGDQLPLFKNRTGTYTVRTTNLQNGYNYIVIVHHTTPGNVAGDRVVGRAEIIIDADTTATAYSNESLHTVTMAGAKYLSGIMYHTSGSLLYNLTINNAYRNTYSSSATAITHISNTANGGALVSAADAALGNNGGNPALAVNITNKVVTISSSGRRRINQAITLSTRVRRTVQNGSADGNTESAGATLSGFLLDNMSDTSTNVLESFTSETSFRLRANVNYDLISQVTSNLWDSQQSLIDGSVGHTTGLQVIDGKLIYPGKHASYPTNFITSTITNGPAFNNGGTGGSARNYGTATGNRTFIRYFYSASNRSNYTVQFNSTQNVGTFVAVGTALTANQMTVEFKLPEQTGWMDAHANFVSGNWSDGNGCYANNLGANRAFNGPWGITTGSRGTELSGGYIVMRVTVGPNFVGSFDSIGFTFVS